MDRIDQKKIASIAKDAIAHSKADETEIVALGGESAVTRFASSAIHQNNYERDLQFSVRAAIGKRVGNSVTNRFDPKELQMTVDRAYEMAKVSEENPDFPGLPRPEPVTYTPPFDEEVMGLTPQWRAGKVKEIIGVAKDGSYQASGFISNGFVYFYAVNYNGLENFCKISKVDSTVLFTGPNSSGYKEGSACTKDGLDVLSIAKEAYDTALKGKDPTDLPEGKYPVVLGYEAVGTLLSYLNYMGISAKALQENESFLSGKMGQKITGSNITIIDDATHPECPGQAFDLEGVPKKRVVIIENGVAKGVPYDSETAKKDNTQSTGHYTGGDWGPYGANLILEAGDQTLDGLIKSVDKGVYVSRFHYVNVVDGMETILTGMTRDGTFLIEKGKITRPLKNFRFTQNVLTALNGCKGITKDRRLFGDGGGYSMFWVSGVLVPALWLEEFNFSGKTAF